MTAAHTLEFLREIEAAASEPALKEQFSQLAHSHEHSHLKSSGPVHFTASGIVVDASGSHVALHFHRKVQAWLQFGGHIDPGEQSFLTAAMREVREESGLDGLTVVGGGPLRLHAHELNSNFVQCTEHWDVQYLLRTAWNAQPGKGSLQCAEAESTQVEWFSLDALPDGLVDDLRPVLAGPVRRAAGH